ncbi:MAG: hypothetical protein F6K21_39485, partial [Symploca sp. SIO2D2]|nr:hypothetical protein [Symploca sp. SIO2D2]
IATATSNNTVAIWDTKSGELIRRLEGHSQSVQSCIFSQDGNTIASIADDNTVTLSDIKSGVLIRRLESHSGSVQSCTFSRDNNMIASASMNNTLSLWDAKTGKKLRTSILYPNHEYATINEATKEVLAASANTWPYLGYTVYDEKLERLRYYPAELFGPLPTG